MEYVPGESLVTYCNRRDLSQEERMGLLVQVYAAVQHAHEKGVIHPDLKPGNILVSDSGQVKVIDFGIAVSLLD